MTPVEIEAELAELRQLLNNPTSGERPIQRFLEKHPYLVCAGYGHVHSGIVIAQFPLPPDWKAGFAFVCQTSSGTHLHLIEIENPEVNIFQGEDDFSQPYNHAFQQLQDWKDWCERNQQSLVNMLAPLFETGGDGTRFICNCKLIAGHRADLSSRKRKLRFASKNAQLPKGLEITTYDGFLEKVPFAQLGQWDRQTIKCVTYKDQDFFEKAVGEP